jgi:purine nucleoside permease
MAAGAAPPRPVKVMLITAFSQESAVWIDKLQLDQAIDVPGLSPAYPAVRCNGDAVCQITTDRGKANASASIAALVFSGLFDLRQTYFIVTGVASVDPARGTTGTAAWSHYLVDADLAWELDTRELPAGWTSGHLGINMKAPGEKPPLHYGTEMYRLDEALLEKALALSRDVVLADTPGARAYRARYPDAPANQAPRVTQCDTLTANTRYHGKLLGERAHDWFKLLTDAQGSYCMAAQEDNAIYTALRRGAEAGLLDDRRVAVLRAAANFDRPAPGQTPLASLEADAGGLAPALQNLYLAANPLVQDIVHRWPAWKGGVSAPFPDHEHQHERGDQPFAPKVMVVNMFGAEAVPFVGGLGLTTKHAVPGLSARYPAVQCDGDDVCQVTTDMGYSNAATSIGTLLYASGFDLRHTYFIIAGIAGINPKYGTLGSTAWADYAVDYSLAHEIDAREMPSGWDYGYFGFSTHSPGEKPRLDYRIEVFHLDPALVARAYRLSRQAVLTDAPSAQAYRAHFPAAPASRPPTVLRCDTVSGDTWFGGATLARRAEDWSALLTDGKASYCTSQQEDNATLEALRRGQAAGKIDSRRVLILRAGSDIDRPPPGQSDSDALLDYAGQGGFGPATANLLLTARPVIREIAGHWERWQNGVPADQAQP